MASQWRGLFDRFASVQASNDNVSLKDFVVAAKGLDQTEREEQREERRQWREYGESRAGAFNDVVQGAARGDSQSQERGQDLGWGREWRGGWSEYDLQEIAADLRLRQESDPPPTGTDPSCSQYQAVSPSGP